MRSSEEVMRCTRSEHVNSALLRWYSGSVQTVLHRGLNEYLRLWIVSEFGMPVKGQVWFGRKNPRIL